MTPEQTDSLAYTIAHFQEVARQNRFPENNKVDHDTHRCVICHPELLPLDPFETYLDVVTQSVKVRRPRLDQGLVDEINKDLDLLGLSVRISLESLLAGDEDAVPYWSDWIREALTTGLDLLSIHSSTSIELSLEDGESRGLEEVVEKRIREVMNYQKTNA
jgi:hypothetical protein